MSIPLDRLYHYIKIIAKEIINDDVLIYRFVSHGSKKLEDLKSLDFYKWVDSATTIPIYCYDQEPLNYNLYVNNESNMIFQNEWMKIKSLSPISLINNLQIYPSIFNQTLLLHSEQRSPELQKYQNNNYIGIYYWNHALLSLDWYRYARHIKQQKRPSTHTFLIYNRAWAGSREYRLKFLDFLIDNNLSTHCKTSFNQIDPDTNINYKNHTFKNLSWKPVHNIEQVFFQTTATSCSSADFDLNDYESTDIEVVLETLFDDERLYLTEKTLRPIACMQPFILVSTHGSLKYLRSYGFKTFDTVWDESYDEIQDPTKRLSTIVSTMEKIANWSKSEKEKKQKEISKIIIHNHRHFFSQEFFDQVIGELKTNIQNSYAQFVLLNDFSIWKSKWKQILNVRPIYEFLGHNKDSSYPNLTDLDKIELLIDNHKLNYKNY